MQTELRIGIIGFDTSHVPAFTKLLNDRSDPLHIPGARVVAGFPSASEDIHSSISCRDDIVQEMRDAYDMKMVNSIEKLVEEVDAVLLESVDGRRHLAEATPVIQAGLPLFIDKPLAANYDAAASIVSLAQKHGCPLFSSSSLRFDANMQATLHDPDLGDVLACDAFSPASLEPTNPGLFWYGIHGVEILYTFMGAGCSSVYCHHSDAYDLVVGTWPDGRIGTMRGTRCGAHDYGVTVYGSKKIAQVGYSRSVPFYHQLLQQIVPFFNGAPAPVAPCETLEIMAFMEAASLSQSTESEIELSEIARAL